MPSYRAAFGKGVVIGAGVATAWAVARYYGRRQACTQLIDWDRATSVAIRACGAGGALELDGKVWGLVEVYRKERRAFSDEDIRVARELIRMT